jgi:XTP/dITP diphosphohydrolase
VCEGNITEYPQGEMGFGYDPVFMPLNANRTFAEMTLEEKNQYSHRGKAVEQLVKFLTKT